MSWSEDMLVSIATNAPSGPLPSQNEGSDADMPQNSTPGMLFCSLENVKLNK